MDLGIDVQKAQLEAQRQKTAEQFFEGKLSVEEEVHRQVMQQVERIRLQGIQDFAKLHGVNPESVSVTQSVDGVTNIPIYSVKP